MVNARQWTSPSGYDSNWWSRGTAGREAAAWLWTIHHPDQNTRILSHVTQNSCKTFHAVSAGVRQRAHRSSPSRGAAQLELIVFLVCADPCPNECLVVAEIPDGPLMVADPNRPLVAFEWFETQRRMLRIGGPKAVLRVGQLPDVGREAEITTPEEISADCLLPPPPLSWCLGCRPLL